MSKFIIQIQGKSIVKFVGVIACCYILMMVLVAEMQDTKKLCDLGLVQMADE